jgi:hypothetical protein
LEFQLKFTIPDVVTDPHLEMCSKAIKIIAVEILRVAEGKAEWNLNKQS